MVTWLASVVSENVVQSRCPIQYGLNVRNDASSGIPCLRTKYNENPLPWLPVLGNSARSIYT